MSSIFTRSMGLAAVSTLSAWLGACGSEVDAEVGQQPLSEIESALTTNADGTIYTMTDTKKKYYLYGRNKYCWVYDMGQNDALAGKTPSNDDWGGQWESGFRNSLMPSFGRSYTGHCKYPTGCFRKRDEDPIYYVNDSSDEFCWLKSPSMVALYCGTKRSYMNIQRLTSEIKFEQKNWFDASNVLHKPARFSYTGDCP